MKSKLVFFFIILLMIGCMGEEKDREKIVEMILYAEPADGGSILSNIWSPQIVFSDSDNDHQKQALTDIIVDGLDFDKYQPGHEYHLKARKIWMQNPPLHVLPVKYQVLEFLSKEKVITQDFEETITLKVSPEKVQFMPRFPYLYDEEGGLPVVIEALRTQDPETLQSHIIPEIEGFDFEPGYEYLLEVRKITRADPYSLLWELSNIFSKTKKN